jgi:fatty acid-binding protein DegV
MHTLAPDDAEELKAALVPVFPHAEFIIQEAGLTLGAHVGPRALALVWIPRCETAMPPLPVDSISD